jgi:hypothetical protein
MASAWQVGSNFMVSINVNSHQARRPPEMMGARP